MKIIQKGNNTLLIKKKLITINYKKDIFSFDSKSVLYYFYIWLLNLNSKHASRQFYMLDQNKKNIDIENEKVIEVVVDHIQPGAVLSHPTYDIRGNLIHGAYIPFSENEIDSLIESGIEKIYYELPENEKDISPVPEQKTDINKGLLEYITSGKYKGPRTISAISQAKAVSVMEKLVDVIRDDVNDPAIYNEARHVVEEILEEIDESDKLVVNLLDIQAYDDYTYTHSLNVGVISMLFARKLNLDDELVKDIGLGGFLHDIGKIKVPHELINKAGKLSDFEFEQIKHHAQIGYETIKNNKFLPDIVKKIVLLHHEKFDGTGYPLKLSSDQIDDFIVLVSLADYFDALTTERSYKKAFTTRETFNLILKKAGIFFKSDLAHRFVKDMIMLYKESDYLEIGDYVLLNTNEIAVVVDKESDLTPRPGIEIIRNENKVLKKPIYIDLNRDSTRHIIAHLDKKVSDDESIEAISERVAEQRKAKSVRL